MPKKWLILAAVLMMTAPLLLSAAQLNSPASRDLRRMESLKEEVRHQLVMLSYYSVFDWITGQVKPDGTVVLTGEVARP
ncbi:MAG TPA: hypothetical protein VGJ22_08670, partial [Anaerolineales bacterium]